MHESEDELVASFNTYRSKLKELFTEEEKIVAQRSKVKVAEDKYSDYVKKARPSDQVKAELDIQKEELNNMESRMEGFKRSHLRDALRVKFESLSLYAAQVCSDGYLLILLTL